MTQVFDPDIVDPRWKDLYRVGGICGILIPVLTILAIAIYFIGPYQPGLTSPAVIFETIQTNKLNGLMSLDFFMVVITIINIPFFVALYAALKKVNESYALLALVFGLIACVVILPARPIAEMFYLSGQYAGATTEAARSQYLSAGEALSALFNGTGWIAYMITYTPAVLIPSLLMLRTKAFNKITAYIGIFMNIGVLSIFAVIPALVVISTLLNLVTTIIGTIWFVLVARTFFQLARCSEA